MPTTARSGKLRRQLVRALEDEGWIRSGPVRDAFLAVPRELFVPEFAEEHGLPAVYRNKVILTKWNAQGLPLSSSSQPAIMASMLEQLQLRDGMRVLEVGAGTGYNAALLSVLVGRRGRVVSVEVDAAIAREARRALRAGGYKARVVVGDGQDGFAELAPYDRIIVTASSDQVPIAWFEQLEPQGLLETPLQLTGAGVQAIPLLRKTRSGFRSTEALAGGFMPLRSAGPEAAVAIEFPVLIASEGGLPLQQLSGDALTTVSARAKRRALSLSLSDGRRRPLGLRALPSALMFFLSLELPTRARITTWPRFGVGVVSADGGSIALIELPPAGRNKTISSLRLFGGDDAEDLLLQHVREWDRRGRPAESQLEIAVSYDESRTSRVRHRWPSARSTSRAGSRGRTRGA